MVFFSLGKAAVALLLTAVIPISAASVPRHENPNTNPILETRASSTVPWQARHGMTPSQYQSTFDALVASGYKPTYISGYPWGNNDARYAAIWDKNTTNPQYQWVSRHGLTSEQYQQWFNTYTSQGYRPRHVSGYASSSSPRYAAIWDKSPSPPGGGWAARHGMTPEQYQSWTSTYAAQGYRPVHVSGYADGGQARYAAIWETAASNNNYPWVARHGLTSYQYQQAFDAYVAQGYRPVKVSGYVVGGVDYYAAIWEKTPSSYPPWVARHGLTSGQYQGEFDKWVAQGYRLTVVSGYTMGGNQDRYAAIWVKE